jgi:hypothetical protein
MKRSTASSTSTVDPARYADARGVEDRLIALIDGGEDLAEWYLIPRDSPKKPAPRTVDLMSTTERAVPRKHKAGRKS